MLSATVNTAIELPTPFRSKTREIHNQSNTIVCSMAIGKQYQETVTSCIDSHINYCQFQKYDYFLETKQQDVHRPIPWSKIKVLQRALENKNNQIVVWD